MLVPGPGDGASGYRLPRTGQWIPASSSTGSAFLALDHRAVDALGVIIVVAIGFSLVASWARRS